MAITIAGPGRRRTPAGRSGRCAARFRRPPTTTITASPTSAHGASGTSEPLADQPGALIEPNDTAESGNRPATGPRRRSALEGRDALAHVDDHLDAPVDGGQHRLAARPRALDAAHRVQVVDPERLHESGRPGGVQGAVA